jgi:glycosyltransferase involved in cell wall biosynthesis
VRDCAPYLPRVLHNVEALGSLFGETACVFVENDSTDATKQILSQWGKTRPNFNLVCLDGLAGVEARTVRLEIARNAYLEYIRSDERLRAFDYLIVLDFDEALSNPVELDEVEKSLDLLRGQGDCAAVFANQTGTYHDMWALRHANLCPGDAWEEVFERSYSTGCSDDVAFAETYAKRLFSLPRDAAPVEVDSAFGGLGLYKMSYVRRNPNPYLGQKIRVLRKDGQTNVTRVQICEHVHFNAGLRNLGGRLFIAPGMINRYFPGIYSPSFFHSLFF